MNNMNSARTPRKGSSSYNRLTRILSFLLVCVSLLQMLPMTAWAAWDGSGDISGGMSSVSGTTKFFRDNEHNIVGYRFSIYDADGNKKGHSIDIDCGINYGYFKNTLAYRYRYPVVAADGSISYDKKSHIDINREFQAYRGKKNADGSYPYSGDRVTLGEPVSVYAGVVNAEHYIYVDESLKDPSDGYSMDDTKMNKR